MAIKAIIFDIGGVLIDIDQSGWMRNVFAQHLDVDISRQQWSDILPPFTRGGMTEHEFYIHAFRALGVPDAEVPEESLFIEAAEAGFSINEQVYQVVTELKDDGYTTAALTNSVPPHTEWHKRNGTYDPFEPVIISNEVGMKKPDLEIYRLTLERIDRGAKETVFIDDAQKNVDAAEALGINGILYENPEQLRADLREFGISV